MCVCSGHLWGHLWPCGADPRPVGDRVLPEAAVLLCQHHRWHQVRPSVSGLFLYVLLWTSVRSGQLGPSVWLGFSVSPFSEWSSRFSWELWQFLDPKANKKKRDQRWKCSALQLHTYQVPEPLEMTTPEQGLHWLPACCCFSDCSGLCSCCGTSSGSQFWSWRSVFCGVCRTLTEISPVRPTSFRPSARTSTR